MSNCQRLLSSLYAKPLCWLYHSFTPFIRSILSFTNKSQNFTLKIHLMWIYKPCGCRRTFDWHVTLRKRRKCLPINPIRAPHVKRRHIRAACIHILFIKMSRRWRPLPCQTLSIITVWHVFHIHQHRPLTRNKFCVLYLEASYTFNTR